MKASDDLKHEHDAILFSLTILEEMISRFESGREVKLDDIMSIIDFLKLFADKCHHGKEEGFLFPVLERAGIPGENGPIGVMLAEHETGRGFIRSMESAVSVNGIITDKFVENAMDYISLLRGHIDKENNVLFPMGDSRLSESDQENLLEKFDDFEERVMGSGKHDEFHNLLTELKKRYLFK